MSKLTTDAWECVDHLDHLAEGGLDLAPDTAARAANLITKLIEETIRLRAALRDAKTALPRASGMPEAEAVAWQVYHPNDGWSETHKDNIDYYKEAGVPVRPLYAAPPPVAAPSGDAIAQAYRAGFKAGKVWAEPTPPVESQETLNPGNQHEDK